MIQINSGCQFFSSTTEKKAGKKFIVAIISAFIFADGFCVSLAVHVRACVWQCFSKKMTISQVELGPWENEEGRKKALK
jgi:hypothetical protein